MYPYRNRMNQQMVKQDGDRIIFPFLLGAVTGGAAVGLTRPRPVFVNQPYYYGPHPYGYGYYGNYGYYNTGYPYYYR